MKEAMAHDGDHGAAANLDSKALQRMVQILTTQHYTLQGARAQVLADLQGRATVFLTTVSGGLVALSFIGQSKMSGLFIAFASIILPMLTVMGVLTYARGLELEAEDLLHSRGIARIRQFYLETTPAIRPYLIHTTHDDIAGMVTDMGIRPNIWQPLFTAPTMIGFVTALLAGTSAAVEANAFGLPVSTGIWLGAASGALTCAALWRGSQALWKSIAGSGESRSPSPASGNAADA